jgi:hypothetical protein
MALGNSGSGDTAFHRALERVIFNNRAIVLALFALVTVAMAFFASQLRVDAGFMKQIPREHPYMSTFVEYMAEFGGANRVLVAVVAKDGDIFDQQYLATLENVTKDVMAMEATDDARVRSLFTPNTRFVEVVEDGFAGGNVIPDTFSPNLEGFTAAPEDFDRIRGNIVKANILGRLVARDWSATMVWADLIPEDQAPGGKLDYQAIGDELEAIRTKYEGDDYSVHIIGFAKMVDDIASGAKSVVLFFAITIAFTWLLLFIYSTSAKLASLTVFAALVAVVWMLGALRLLGYGIDPMNMLTPFLIFAIAVSHGEQMINRFRGEIFFGGMEDGSPEELAQRRGISPLEAAKASFRLLLIPGTVALLAGCIGFATIMLIEIQMVRELAITATVGVGLTLLTNLVLLPVLLSYTRLRNMDRKREFRLRQLTQFDKIWAVLSRLSKPVPAAVVVVAGALIWFFAEAHGDKVMIGDAESGVAELRPESRFNRDAGEITQRFALGIDTINVIVETSPDACTNYRVMEVIDRLSWRLANVEGVQQVISLPMAAKIANAGWNEGNVRWRELPRVPDNLRTATQSFETDTGLLNNDCSVMPVTVFLTDHKATTIDRVVKAIKDFRESETANVAGIRTVLGLAEDAALPDLDRTGIREKLAEAHMTAMSDPSTEALNVINPRIGTGNVGVAAAINDEVRSREHVMLWLLYAAVFLMCLLSFKNPLAAACIVLPLILVTELGHSLMVELDIGMKVNTLTVVALGVGIGVDYAIYIFARMREAMLSGKTLSESYFIALKTTGIAIFYTALTLAVGVATWILSDLKFQADMGLMLTFLFVVNMIAAIVFLPALCRFLLRPTEKDGWQPPH